MATIVPNVVSPSVVEFIMTGFPAGEHVVLTFDRRIDGRTETLDTYIGYNPTHILQVGFGLDASGTWEVEAVGQVTGTAARTSVDIGDVFVPPVNSGGQEFNEQPQSAENGWLVPALILGGGLLLLS